MPTYEYECNRCGLLFEEFKPMSAPARKRCPECRGKVNRLISGGVGIVFKGSGFYANDSRPKRVESETETSGSATNTGKTESAGNNSSTPGNDKT